MPKGQYIACQAIADDTSWSLVCSRVPESLDYKLYNKQGAIVGTLPFADEESAIEFENSVSAAMLAYNGQEVYFEGESQFVLPENFTVIP